MRTPITYYGGKQKLVKELLPLVPSHRLYVEPFAGGGALFFAKEPSEAEIINDLDGNVSNFYRIAKTSFYQLKELIDGTLHSRAVYKEALMIYKNPAGYNNITRAWTFWVLTNQGFSGKIGSWALSRDGKIGKTLFNKREGFTQEYAERLKCVQIENKDALEIIEQYDSKDSFFYIDPPYFNSDCGHYKGYSEADYRNLLEIVVNIKGKFLLSSYPSEILNEYVKRYDWKYKEIKRKIAVTKNTDKQKTEVLVWNYQTETSFQSKNKEARMHNPVEKSKRDRVINVEQEVKNSCPIRLPVTHKIRNFDPTKASPTEKKQLSLEACKRILERDGKKYTDEEVLKIRQLLYRVGNLEYQLFTELKNKQDDKRNSLRKGQYRRTSSQRDKYSLSKREAGTIL